MWDSSLWQQQDDSKLKELSGNVLYFCRELGKKSYRAHVFIAQYSSLWELRENWEKLNNEVAFLYQSSVDSLLERSNFYICLFVTDKVDVAEKARIENDAYCAKKFIFEFDAANLEEKLRLIDEKIFDLEYLEENLQKETNLLSVNVKNFRVYEGQKAFSFSAENDPRIPASLVMIYAPNGAGKTSICDAIEWGLTGNVQRLETMEKTMGKGKMLLHNREKYKSVKEYADNDERAWVELTWKENDGSVNTLRRTVRRSENDLRPGQTKGEKERFQKGLLWNQVIMPHDRIEEFIGATRPADRYEEWMDCIDPQKELRRSYENKNKAYLDSKRQCRDRETEVKKLRIEQEKLSKAEEESRELDKNIRQYNEIAPENYQIQSESAELTVEKFLDAQTKARSYTEAIRKEKTRLKKNDDLLKEYLKEDGAAFVKLESELVQRQKDYGRCCKTLQDRIVYEELQAKWKQAQESGQGIKEEHRLLQYILRQGEAAMEEKKVRLDLVQTQLPEQKRKLQRISGRLDYVEKAQSEQEQKIKRIDEENEENKRLLDIAKKQRKLENEKLVAAEHAAQKRTVVEKAKSDQLKKQRAYYEMLSYILPDTIEQYEKHRVPKDDAMFYYAGRLDDLLQQWNKIECGRKEYEEQLRKLKIADEQLSYIAKEGRIFLEQHPKECECPLCHTRFDNWNALYSATLKLKDSQKTQLKWKAEQLEQEKMRLARKYGDLLVEWNSERTQRSERLSRECKEAAENAEKAEAAKKSVEMAVCVIEEQKQKNQAQAIQLGWSQKEEFNTVNVEAAVYERSASQERRMKEALRRQAELKVQQTSLQAEKEQCEQKILELRKWKQEMEKEPFCMESIRYIQKELLGLQAAERNNEVEKAIKELDERQEQLQKEMLKLHEVSEKPKRLCEQEKNEAGSKVREIQRTYDELCEIVHTEKPTLAILQQRREEIAEKQGKADILLEKLVKIKNSGGMFENFRNYKNNEKKLQSLERKVDEKKLEVEKAEKAVEQEKEKLLNELQAYFRQPLFNEIYQKIDPHPYMKNVEYQLKYNEEKNEPELYINTRTEDQNVYQPEWFFSTAQLNTVALSSFLSRALSLTELPIGTILIDDPVGHFDDMNILGFADLIRSILEKSGKQIIITTHDETVYQIFHRKLPPEKYRSRFIDMTLA